MTTTPFHHVMMTTPGPWETDGVAEVDFHVVGEFVLLLQALEHVIPMTLGPSEVAEILDKARVYLGRRDRDGSKTTVLDEPLHALPLELACRLREGEGVVLRLQTPIECKGMELHLKGMFEEAS